MNRENISHPERRHDRSEHPLLALQHLVEALLARSAAHAVALVDEDGRMVAGAGSSERLSSLAAIAKPVAQGKADGLGAPWEAATRDTDFFGAPIDTAWGTFLFAALGERLRRLPDAAAGVRRICASSSAF